MKITLIRTKGKNEVYARYGLEEVVHAIKTGWRNHTVTHLRVVYQLMTKERQADGQILTNWKAASSWSASVSVRNSTNTRRVAECWVTTD